jgi:hypothetical protein
MTIKGRKSAGSSTPATKPNPPPTKSRLTKKRSNARSSSPTATPAASSKQDRCLNLLARRDGATLVELVAATDWQPHSVRGFLAGTVKKKLGLTLHAAQGNDGARRYRIDRPSRSR